MSEFPRKDLLVATLHE